MAVTYKRQDDLEKMLEEFASFENWKKLSIQIQNQKNIPRKQLESG